MNEVEKLNLTSLWLVRTCYETGAQEMTVTKEGVTHEGKPIGDWEIIVRKK